MTKLEIVPLTEAIALKHYGKKPDKTIRGFAAVHGDDVFGVWGLYLYHDKAVVFTELSDEMKKDKRSIVKGICSIKRLIEHINLPVFAVADTKISGSDVLLRHAGFKQVENEVYQWLS